MDDPREHRAERALRRAADAASSIVSERCPSATAPSASEPSATATGAKAPGERAGRARAFGNGDAIGHGSRLPAGLGYPSRLGMQRADRRATTDQLPAAASAAWRCSLRNRSASSAAAHPEPAAVTACR